MRGDANYSCERILVAPEDLNEVKAKTAWEVFTDGSGMKPKVDKKSGWGLWDVETLVCVGTLLYHLSTVLCCSSIRGSEHDLLFTADASATICLWHVKGRAAREVDNDEVTPVCTNDGRPVAIASEAQERPSLSSPCSPTADATDPTIRACPRRYYAIS